MASLHRFHPFIQATAVSASLLCAAPSPGAEPLFLQWGKIDTSAVASQAKSIAAPTRKASPSERMACIVQFESAVTEEWLEWLRGATQIRGYIPENAYLVWATAAEMETVAAHEGVYWIGEWKKEYKTVHAGTASASSKAAARWMHVSSLLSGTDGAADLRTRLEKLGSDVRSAFAQLDGSAAVALLTDSQIDEVAGWADVEWIEPKFAPSFSNDKAALSNMMNVAAVWRSASDGGLGLSGSGQIVAVTDSGCDKGSITDVHEDLAGRIVAGYGWSNRTYNAAYSWADTHSHGTHVVGSILGNGSKSGGLYRGMAWNASLVMQGVQEDLSGLPDNIQNLFKQARNAGAYIHSDSWGEDADDETGRYTAVAANADDYMWSNQDFLMVVAAGNESVDADKDGIVDPGSITPPATAKNSICVGASENYRNTGGYSKYKWGQGWPSKYPADPIKSAKISSTAVPQGLAAFSGRGPTTDGRIKPDIVAPGTDVISLRSRAATDTGWGKVDSNYIYNGGTSMATPLVSGTIALIRQWLVEKQGMSKPPAALMKALLIAGARDMAPGQYGTGQYQEIHPRPDCSQGFGHVDLAKSLEQSESTFLTMVSSKMTRTGASYSTSIDIGAVNAGRYVLTLVWQDYPGKTSASKALVNDLDLSVTTPSGTVLYPNNLSEADRLNNVELIEFEAEETGTYAVNVKAYKINWIFGTTQGQSFALVMRGPETTRPAFSDPAPAMTVTCGDNASFDFAALLSSGKWPAPTFSITTDVPSSLWTFDTDAGTLSFQSADPGNYEFVVSASNGKGSATTCLHVEVVSKSPAGFNIWIGRDDTSYATPFDVAHYGHPYCDNNVARENTSSSLQH